VLSAQRKDPISISLLATEQAELALGSDEIQVGVLALHQSVLDGNHIDAAELHGPTVRLHDNFPKRKGLRQGSGDRIRESQAELALLTAIPANRLAAAALAELLSRRRGLERACETLVAWARGA
jgi:hypothetical protein